jgi:hypothetical protein
MEDELIHLLCGIDRLFNDLIDCNYIKINNIVKNYYLIKNDPYMDNLDYVYELEIVKEEYLFQLNELMTYAKALRDKLEND